MKALIQRQEEELIRLREEVEFLKEGKKLVIWKQREAATRIQQLEAALREIARYVPEEGCPCSACEHSAIARAALGEKA